jgi:DNA helicase-2/ATP-dependent DNA helicase PcrA
MTFVHRIDGAPGAGKTHTLLDVIEREVDENDIALADIRYLNFTNAGKKDSKAALMDRLDGVDDDLADEVVGTFHSAALRSVADAGYFDYDGDDIIQPSSDPEVYRSFARSQGINYGGGTLQDLEENGEIDGAADAFFAINDWLASTYRKPQDARKAPTRFPWRDVGTFERLRDEWQHFKRTYDPEKRLWEHHEYVEKAIAERVYPLATVLLIDEFQDLSPLEYKYYKEWRDNGDVERIYIAGDPNQSIYSFRGADPRYFNGTDHDDETVLNETYRCRGNIATIARRILQDSSGNDTRDFTARFDGGTVEYRTGGKNELQAALEAATATDTDSVLLLTRTNRQWRQVAKFLRATGFPYGVLGTRGWSMWDKKEHMDLLEALRSMKAGERVESWAGLELLDAAPRSTDRKSVASMDEDGFTASSLWDAFNDTRTVGEIVDKLDIRSTYADAIKNALARDGHNKPSQIRVGTIHTSKGLEADTAILFPSYGRDMLDDYVKDRETHAEEHRVAYVGATRARKRLQVFTNFFGSKHTMPVFTTPDVREVAA